QVNRSSEVVRILDKERPLLREKDFEPLVDRDLRIVRLDLAEVRIAGNIHHQAFAKNEFRVEAELASRQSIREMRCGRILGIERMKGVEQTVRNQLDVSSRLDAFHAVSDSGAGQPALYLAGHRGPERVLILPVNPTVKNDSPALLRQGIKTQAAERNGKPHHETLAGQAPPRVPEGIEGRIEMRVVADAAHVALRRFGINGVPLHAQRVSLKRIGPALVMECVQDYFDLVI